MLATSCWRSSVVIDSGSRVEITAVLLEGGAEASCPPPLVTYAVCRSVRPPCDNICMCLYCRFGRLSLLVAKKRNHFVPRFLLRRFASRRTGSKAWIWLFRRGCSPREVSVADAGVASYFYGQPESGVEDGLATVEARHALLVDQLLSGEAPETLHDEINELVWLMAVRTDNLRSSFGTMIEKGLDAMAASASSDAARSALNRQVHKIFDTELDAVLDRLGSLGGIIRAKLDNDPKLRDALRAQAAKELDRLDLSSTCGSILQSALQQKSLEESMLDGHVRALAKLLEDNPIPDRFKTATWQVQRFPEQVLVLGDGLVVARRRDGEFGHPIRFAKDWQQLWVPLAANTMLIAGQNGNGDAAPTANEVNKQSVMLSHACFFAATDRLAPKELVPLLGTGVSGLADEEISQIIMETWDGL